MLKIGVFKIIFKLILKNRRPNILINLTILSGKLLKTIVIPMDIGSTIILLVLRKLILLLFLK